MKSFTTLIDEELYKNLKNLAGKRNLKIKGLLNEAINDLLKKYKE